MPKIDNDKFYTSALKQYGKSARGVNWSSQESQEIRFKTILELLPQDLSKYNIGDAGCGFGDFYSYMIIHNKKPKNYLGIDSLAQMCTIAKAQTKSDILHLNICQDKLPTQDYYICSGALNILTHFESYLFIQNCYKSSKNGFIFNVLYGDKESQSYNYLNNYHVEKFAKDLGVVNVVLRDDYLLHDITIGFFK